MLSGAVPATSGDIYVRGQKVNIRSTTDAIAQGIETIYQDSALVTQLSIARNLFLGREPINGPRFLNRMDHALMEQVARDLLKKVGIGKDIPPDTPIGSLSGGERQAVAIARAMHFDSDLIILDEPTNNLGVAETQGVLRFVRNARDSGHSCIFIAHNIHHVFQVVDRIVVMRRGKIVADDIDPETHERRGSRGGDYRGMTGADAGSAAGRFIRGLLRLLARPERLRPARFGDLAAAADRQRIRLDVLGDRPSRSRHRRPAPIVTGATSAELEPMKAPAPISVRNFEKPS